MSHSIYREEILDLYRNPMNFGELKNPSCEFEEFNPLCGDRIKMSVNVEDSKIKGIKFSGNGCAISTASCSLLTEMVKGMEVSKVMKLDESYLRDLIKIDISSGRMKCLTISLIALKKALEEQND